MTGRNSGLEASVSVLPIQATSAKVDASTLVGYVIPRQADAKTKNPLIFYQGNVKIECLGKV